MAEEIRVELDNLKDGDWLVMSKNSLFWKARLDPSDEADSTILSISYGKNLSQAMNAETSQAFEHTDRNKAMHALSKLIKEKVKSGYGLYRNKSQDKENKPADKKGGKKSPIRSGKMSKIEIDQIEHRCNHIPLILTEDFEQRNLYKTAEKVRDDDLDDATLGKRSKSNTKKTRQNRRDEEIKDYGAILPQAMTIDEILDKPSGNKKAQEFETANRVPENTPRKEQSTRKQPSSQKSVKSKISNLSEVKEVPASQTKTPSNQKVPKSADKATNENMDEDEISKPSVEINQMMECKINGSDLYKIANNTRQFTRHVIIQVRDEYLYFEHSVAEDLTLISKLLIQFSSNEMAVEASNIQTFHLEEKGFKTSNSEPPNLITPGTVTTMKQRESDFKDCSTGEPREILEKTSEILSLNLCSATNKTTPDIIAEEKVVEKQMVGDNMDFELLSHSELSLNGDISGKLKARSSELSANEITSRKQEMDKYNEEMKKPNGISGNRHIQALGPNSDSMIALMLLNQYKSTIEVSSKFKMTKTG